MEINLKNANLNFLEKHFNSLFQIEFLKLDVPLITFQEIAGYPNYENVLSNIYKFFLEFDHHGLEDLFLQALDDCFNEEVVLMEECYVHREYYTKNGGRIDLVLSNSEDIEKASQIIIIENKIFHQLDNDLEDYWNTFSEVKQKTGIVLSLKPLQIALPFLNITHDVWMEKVKSRLGNYLNSIIRSSSKID